MRGATGRKQNAMMHQQLKSFETMLRTFLEGHETGSLYRALARVIPHNRHVYSLDGLNDYANQWYRDREEIHVDDHSIIKRIEEFNQEILYLKQMKTIFDDRIYSVLFEFYYEMVMEEIPQATKLLERGRRASNDVRGSNLLVMSNIEGYAALHEPMPVKKLCDISKDCEKLFSIIHQLQHIDIRWGSLLKSEEVDVELFDPDSIHDVKLYPNYLRFEAVLRLIPDVMRKIQSAIKLTKSWWYQAERIRRRLRGQKIRDDIASDQPSENDPNQIAESLEENEPMTEQIPTKGHSTTPYRSSSDHKTEAVRDIDEYTNYHSPSVDYRIEDRQHIDNDEEGSGRPIERNPYTEEDKPSQSRINPEQEMITPRQTYPAVIETVENRLKELSTSIALTQMDLASETNELEFFNRRQQRIRKLKSNLKRAINAMEAMHDELKSYRRVKEQLILQLEEVEDLSERRHISGKLKTLDEKVKDIQELSQVIEYRHKLMTSDLKLELDLRETFTRYQNEVEGRVDLLKSSVQEEEEKRVQLEHELMLLRPQAVLDGQDHECLQDNRTSNKARQNVYQMNKSRSVPRASKNGMKSVPWFGNSSQSLDESNRTDDDLDNINRESYSPDLLLGQLRSDNSSWDQQRILDDRKHLNRTTSSPDILSHMRRTSLDSGVNGSRIMNRDNMVRPGKGKKNPRLSHQMPQTSGDTSDHDSAKDIQDRSSTKQTQRTSVPEIKYVPPSSKGKKKHRKPKAPERILSDENEDVNDSFGYGGYNSRHGGPYQDTNHSDHNDRGTDEGRNRQRRPSSPTKRSNLPTRNLKRLPRGSLGLNNKAAPVQKQPPLPQLREEDDPSPAPRKDRTPRMYDPKRGSLDSVINSPLPLYSYMPLSVDQSGKRELGGDGGSRKVKNAHRRKPRIKSDQPDILSPLYKPNQTQRRKNPPVSHIPVKTTY
eukprot:XP_011660548.1 PREDICTED: uncharacterized protein LOC105436583 [Strongylocentrotus purpuratus]